MGIQFQPPPYNPPPQDFSDITQPIFQAGQLLNQTRQINNQNRYQDVMARIAQEKEARESAQFTNDWKMPAPQPGPMQGPANMPFAMPQGQGPAPYQSSIPDSMEPYTPTGPVTDPNMTPDFSQPQQGGVVAKFRQWQDQQRQGGSPQGAQAMPQPMQGPQRYSEPPPAPRQGIYGLTPAQMDETNQYGPKRLEMFSKYSDNLKTQSEIGKNNAMAALYGRGGGTGGRSTLLTPQQSKVILSGDEDAIAAEFPNGIPMAALNILKSSGNQALTREDTARGQFQTQNKDFFDTHQSFQRVVDSAKDPSAAGDLALIFNYMKMLDPGSTVREGEFAQAAQSGSIPSQLVAQYNKVVEGERLAPNMRDDFVNRAGMLYKGQRKLYESSVSEAEKVASQGGLNSKRAVVYKPDISGNVGKGSGQMVTIRDSQGGMHQIPSANLSAAQKRDPGLQVVQ